MNDKKEPEDYSYDEIELGKVVEFEKEITEEMVYRFADLTGDYNPLHTNEMYAKKTQFGERIVHGMLLASLFSTLVGMYCPGKKSLYLTQNLNFRAPLPFNKTIKVKGEVINKNDSVKIISIKTFILDQNESIIVDGEAKVKVT